MDSMELHVSLVWRRPQVENLEVRYLGPVPQSKSTQIAGIYPHHKHDSQYGDPAYPVFVNFGPSSLSLLGLLKHSLTDRNGRRHATDHRRHLWSGSASNLGPRGSRYSAIIELGLKNHVWYGVGGA